MSEDPTKEEPTKSKTPEAPVDNSSDSYKLLAGFFALTTVGLLAATIALAVTDSSSSSSSVPPVGDPESSNTTALLTALLTATPPAAENPCEGKKPNASNIECVIGQINEQSGVNVTKGYQGDFNTSAVPIMVPFYQTNLCPVNVHWHLGTEHYSAGQYDENGKGPEPKDEVHRRLNGRLGYQCNLYDESDPKFTTEYKWKFCSEHMEVGQTYEVHWPHSAAGACGTPNQYQTPFPDGVFCGAITDTAAEIGVQGQVFTVVNDESYYYPSLINGMIVDGEMGKDVAKYTGSTTGDSINNTICSPFTPISWHVDRVCHLISASSFDKLCADMLSMRDDMTKDLEPHGSRELVDDEFAANNQNRHWLRK